MRRWARLIALSLPALVVLAGALFLLFKYVTWRSFVEQRAQFGAVVHQPTPVVAIETPGAERFSNGLASFETDAAIEFVTTAFGSAFIDGPDARIAIDPGITADEVDVGEGVLAVEDQKFLMSVVTYSGRLEAFATVRLLRFTDWITASASERERWLATLAMASAISLYGDVTGIETIETTDAKSIIFTTSTGLQIESWSPDEQVTVGSDVWHADPAILQQLARQIASSIRFEAEPFPATREERIEIANTTVRAHPLFKPSPGDPDPVAPTESPSPQ